MRIVDRLRCYFFCATIVGSLGLLESFAIANPPYEVYPYLAEETDNPPVNYMKVCEPGRTGEENASYVVLGISFPRTYQAVDADFDDDLVVPAYIDGLPVRKINEAAFVACTGLRSIKIPSTVREIGARVFSDCWNLTNVIFESGIATIGDNAFSNCISLASITFPKTLSRLGAGCFHGCVSLKDVYFKGNAPRLVIPNMSDKSPFGEMIFRNYGYYERFKIHINKNTYGWISPHEKGVPEKWPVDFGYIQAHETVAEDGDEIGVANVGFVVVITEIKGAPVAVPESWAAKYSGYVQNFGNNFALSLTRPTGKKDAAGKSLQVWHDYVAGTDPTDLNDVFTATIKIVDDKPVISVVPALSEGEKSIRKYTVYGKVSLKDTDWIEVKTGKEGEYNFFKVTVEMK
ncbi:MAG: leucine-rich repeat domain-containing protein [Kiritimatiellae bacterium]|nr:leucine-rich repeat domain-containing protein [Kiritimatiellia bacterium]